MCVLCIGLIRAEVNVYTDGTIDHVALEPQNEIYLIPSLLLALSMGKVDIIVHYKSLRMPGMLLK